MRVVVCAPQVPFARGGTEILVENLVEELRRRDHEAELVTIPFRWARTLTGSGGMVIWPVPVAGS